ncbi:Myb-like DNA-binding domain containing protein [Trichomonas vaginalis G3]|uniref:Myb-like DNA-binding domain containing protein n=1 Tax=Trichomonas vaginalis (strain ATCC PRA-98 / G3) TaxID=412133 RepID=A2EUU4_TRIV3|nr:RNA polymerase II transcription regulator recruiting protein [Trichomonas vaginalis G3]EAY03553.1 Myb-like DNA-binding domain containing protein [Trichomonas vaginalis G3]KAI5550054.1 RNA polymerase II transcription regulator recruiting protein [Trichomonas vaginalis G3]|eukprot:XP_001315776.1 Myb-like DNA-binding domain containing protein [Trichomonas vaginalis G3]
MSHDQLDESSPYIYDQALMQVPVGTIYQVKRLFFDLITKKISFQEACKQCFSISQTDKPIKILNEYLCHVKSEQLQRNYSKNMISKDVLAKKVKAWSPLEDQRLIAAISIYGIENWKQITNFVGNSRTRSQCSQKWNRSLNPLINKNQWTQQEDQALLRATTLYGDHSWARVAEEVEGRTDVQCRYRYNLISKKYPHDLGLTSNQIFKFLSTGEVPIKHCKTESAPMYNPKSHDSPKIEAITVKKTESSFPNDDCDKFDDIFEQLKLSEWIGDLESDITHQNSEI